MRRTQSASCRPGSQAAEWRAARSNGHATDTSAIHEMQLDESKSHSWSFWFIWFQVTSHPMLVGSALLLRRSQLFTVFAAGKNVWPCQTWSLRGVAGPWIPSTWADAVKHALQICQICQICSVQIYLDQPHSMAILNILSLIAWFLRRWLESRGASWQGWTGWLRWSKIRWVPDRNWCRRRIFGIAVPITTGLRSHSTSVNPD